MAATAADDEYLIASTAVDSAFYRWLDPEVARTGADPVRDYLERGWREGRDPAPWFSVERYLDAHPDVAASGAQPLLHYLLHGRREGRAVFPSQHVAAYWREQGAPAWTFEPRGFGPPPPESPPEAQPDIEPELEPGPLPGAADRLIVAPEFDRGFYLAAYPFLAEADIDPLDHFLAYGWREGCDPAPWFSVGDYLGDNPDVAAAGVNPFVHYIQVGRAEGRTPQHALGFRYGVIAAAKPLATRMGEAAARAQSVSALSAAAFAEAGRESRTGLKDLHLTFSHDDYTAHGGGVQLCLQYESARMAELGRDHLHLSPATAWPMLRRSEEASLDVVLNGRPLGAFSPAAIAMGLRAARKGAVSGSFAIHNLLGHRVDEVLAILDAAGLEDGFFWLHDFTSLCAGYQLLRNDVEDCGAPPPDSAACGICLYGPARGAQIAEHERLFRALRLTVLSPSQTTLDFWRAASAYPTAGEVVHPHARLLPRPGRPPLSEPGPLRLAFVGMPAAHKGWPVFAELARAYAADPRYHFLHLGSRPDPRMMSLEFHPVSVSLAEPRAMQQALERLQVDVAVIWSIFRETFCLAAYEAVAAGCAVVTGPDSANVAAFVESTGFGRVLADEAALARAIAGGDLLGLARSVRQPVLYDLAFSGMTADLLASRVAA